jgi:hypothetical protein
MFCHLHKNAPPHPKINTKEKYANSGIFPGKQNLYFTNFTWIGFNADPDLAFYLNPDLGSGS